MSNNIIAGLLETCKRQHKAIDMLMAMLIEHDKTFMPSKSAVWPTIYAAAQTINHVERLLHLQQLSREENEKIDSLIDAFKLDNRI